MADHFKALCNPYQDCFSLKAPSYPAVVQRRSSQLGEAL